MLDKEQSPKTFKMFLTMVDDIQKGWISGLLSSIGIPNNQQTRHFGSVPV
jgi:hypothetical protein